MPLPLPPGFPSPSPSPKGAWEGDGAVRKKVTASLLVTVHARPFAQGRSARGRYASPRLARKICCPFGAALGHHWANSGLTLGFLLIFLLISERFVYLHRRRPMQGSFNRLTITIKSTKIMAKSSNIIGTIAGKAGSMVFSKGPDGSTIMRAYQPQVANPRTDAQMTQRAKVILSGKLSKIIPAGAISCLMQGTTLKNRSRFTRQILELASVATSGGVKTASVRPQDIIFSEGIVPMSATVGSVTLTATSATVAISGVTANGANGLRLVAIVLNPNRSDAYEACTFKDTVLQAETTSVVLNLPVSLQDGQSVLIYACPFRLVNRSNNVRSAGVWLDTDVIAELGLGLANSAEFGPSGYNSATVFHQA